jgi:hypothetical protein
MSSERSEASSRSSREVAAGLGAVADGAEREAGEDVAAGQRAQGAGAARAGGDQPEERGREHEARGQQRADVRTLPVGELAEDPHRAERGGGGEAQEGAGGGHGGMVAEETCRSDLDILQ